jgi:hypothetical protein
MVELLITLFGFFEREKPREDELGKQCAYFLQYVNSLYYTQLGELEKKQYWKVALAYVLNGMLRRLNVL